MQQRLREYLYKGLETCLRFQFVVVVYYSNNIFTCEFILRPRRDILLWDFRKLNKDTYAAQRSSGHPLHKCPNFRNAYKKPSETLQCSVLHKTYLCVSAVVRTQLRSDKQEPTVGDLASKRWEGCRLLSAKGRLLTTQQANTCT